MVICDYSLEDGNARDVYKLVTAEVFLVFSGHIIEPWASDVSVLQKPVDLDQLLETIVNLLSEPESRVRLKCGTK